MQLGTGSGTAKGKKSENASHEGQKEASHSSQPPLVRLLLLGDSAVGKSSLLLRFSDRRFESNFVITIGVDFRTKVVSIDGKPYRVQVWDTAGQERFRTITPAYYRNAMGMVLVFDITNRKTFDNVEGWLKTIHEHAPANIVKVLVGNKVDLVSAAGGAQKRKVTNEEANALATKYDMKYFETSAKDDLNVDATFSYIAKSVIQVNPALSTNERESEGSSAASGSANKRVRASSRNPGNTGRASHCCGSSS